MAFTINDITKDLLLEGDDWRIAMDTLVGPVFQFTYLLFDLCVAIGIHDDKYLKHEKVKDEYQTSIPRTVLLRRFDDKYNYLFETAILGTTCFNYTDEEKVQIAYDDNPSVTVYGFDVLLLFANYGVKKLVELIDQTYLNTTVTKIMNYIENLSQDIDDEKVSQELDDIAL